MYKLNAEEFEWQMPILHLCTTSDTHTEASTAQSTATTRPQILEAERETLTAKIGTFVLLSKSRLQ